MGNSSASLLSADQAAFDVAVKAQHDFDYRGVADLESHRSSLGPFVNQLVDIRDSFNAALAIEGQHIIGDAPHSPFYFDYLDSDISNALSFGDATHSFIGVTIPLVLAGC